VLHETSLNNYGAIGAPAFAALAVRADVNRRRILISNHRACH
jgi:hypothetical protein